MATPSTPKERSFCRYQEVPDMSENGGKYGKVVTIFVGPEFRSFKVHLARLGPLSKLYDKEPGNVVAELPREDPDAFNLLINWVYNEPLPRAVSKVEGVKIAANLEPVDPHAPLPIKSTKENILPAKRKLEETESSYSSRVNSLINSLAEEAQKTQDTLLDLMGIAERHGWEMLYNAAVDVFREGEAGIERRYPSLAQIEKVYKMTSPDSAMRQFFCDYAYSLAKKTRMYQGICKRNSSRGTLSF